MASAEPPGWTLPRLRIDREGAWFHEDGEITHPGVVANLWDNLRVDAQGHYLQIGTVRVPVEVEGAAWVVLRVEEEAGRLVLLLADMSREPLDPATLRFGPGGVPYCRVKGGRFDARLSRAAAWQLLQHVQADEAAGRAALVVGGVRYPLEGLLEPPPGA
jgi:hypothetical protein